MARKPKPTTIHDALNEYTDKIVHHAMERGKLQERLRIGKLLTKRMENTADPVEMNLIKQLFDQLDTND